MHVMFIPYVNGTNSCKSYAFACCLILLWFIGSVNPLCDISQNLYIADVISWMFYIAIAYSYKWNILGTWELI